MDIIKHSLTRIIFALFLSLTLSLAYADNDDITVNAGNDQAVSAGDTVLLSGTLTFEEDDDDKDKHKKHKKHKKHGKHGKHEKHKKHKKSHDDDGDDEITINWSQNSGTAVTILNPATLTPSFVAPSVTADENLGFTLSVSDDDGDLIASASVLVTVKAPVIPTSTITGRITSVDGTELANASINVLSAGSSLTTATTALNGQFSIELNANTQAVLQINLAGYAEQIVPVSSPDADGSVFFDITMIARGAVQTFSAVADATLTGTDGSSVSVLAGSFVDGNGIAVTGDINLTITPVDVSRPAALAAFPGEFSGTAEGATTDSTILSFGTVEFEFSQNGQPLQLAPGTTADVVIPMYFDVYQDGTAVALGDTIPLWSLNEETGIWLQEGVGTVIASAESPTGFAMQATVGHFSWWNCDVSANAARAIVTVTAPEAGTALIKARTMANIGWRPDTVETVATVGVPTQPLSVPSNGEVCFWAEITFNSGGLSTTPETCLIPPAGSLFNVSLASAVAGPVAITTTPAATAGVLDMVGFLGFPIERVQIQPTTLETLVNYTIISGSLPAGLTLNSVNTTRSEIVGVVAAVGSFSAVVQATDVDSNTDMITINYTVTADTPPPRLEGPQFPNIIFQEYTSTLAPTTSIDMNVYNQGGAATSWSLDFIPQFEQFEVPAWLSISADGILTIEGSCRFWQLDLTAINANGSSTIRLDIQDINCGEFAA